MHGGAYSGTEEMKYIWSLNWEFAKLYAGYRAPNFMYQVLYMDLAFWSCAVLWLTAISISIAIVHVKTMFPVT